MSSKPPSGDSFLGSDVQSGKNIVGAENLDHEQRLLAETYVELSSSPGVFVGAMSGSANWDIRPLILSDGSLYILRVTSPRHFIDKARYDFFKKWAEKFRAFNKRASGITLGEDQGRWWVLRKFYSKTLAEISAGQDGPDFPRETLVKDILNQVNLLHSAGLVHGHICNSNLAIEAERLLLFDHLFASIDTDNMKGDIAPEIADGRLPGTHSDTYNLGLLLDFWLEAEQFPALPGLTQKMLSSNPNERPAISEVIRQLWPEEQQVKKVYRDSRILKRENLKTGKLVTLHGTTPSPGPKVPNTEREPPKDLAIIAEREVSVIQPDSRETLKKETSNTAKPLKTSSSRSVIYAALIIVCGIFFVYRYDLLPWEVDDSPYELYWNSNQRSLMEQVAVAAASSKSRAQIVVTGSVLSGSTHPDVHEKIISIAFNEKWERELSRLDREMVFRLALSRFLPDELKGVQSLSDAHPGVLLAITGSSSIETEWPELSGIGLERFTLLPDPYGLSFTELADQGSTSIAAVESRALSQIIAGNASVRTIEAFLNSNADEAVSTRRLRLLISLFRQVPSLQELIESNTGSLGGFLESRLAWFAAEDIASWSSPEVTMMDKLFLAAGVPPGAKFRFEQLADLLQFPDDSVRDFAKAELTSSYLPEHLDGITTVMAGKESNLTRYQTVTLAFAMGLEPERAYPFIADWFTSDPDPDTVVQLLARHRIEDDLDSFSLEAARYLKSEEWSADINDLELLASHNEPLVRALAYSRLDASRATDAAILKKRLQLETSERLKEDIKRRLQ